MKELHHAAQPLKKHRHSKHGEKIDTGHGRARPFDRHPLLDMGVHDPAGAAEKTKKEKKDA